MVDEHKTCVYCNQRRALDYAEARGLCAKCFKDSIYNYKYRRLVKWADEARLCRGGEWSADMVIDQMLEDSEILVEILK